MTHSLLVAAGGMLGSLARYWLTLFVQRYDGSSFPSGTFAVNVLGSFIIGLVMVLSLEREVLSHEGRVFLTIGFCGGFTTMSAFSFETLALLRAGELGVAAAYVGLSLVLCVGAASLGWVVGRTMA
ncbi:MAG: fluoride efflux transporter CrcB [Deltaproteobacteria bacterium]|nr:fluoride efflux transporter CrcB [Deltaproteobacteria bacterium]